jgi:hypothetical protein
MVNRLRGEASFTVAGESFRMVFDAEALLQIEDKLGLGLGGMYKELAAAQADPAAMKMATISTIIACGLQENHPDADRGLAFDLLLADPQAVQGALAEALSRAMPEPRGDKGAGTADANPPIAMENPGTGTNSSSPGASPDSLRTSSGNPPRG